MNASSTPVLFECCQLLYATQSGRAKACARRVERRLRTACPRLPLAGPTRSLDEATAADGAQSSLKDVIQQWKQKKVLLILFISTTGDGEPTDTMRQTWKLL